MHHLRYAWPTLLFVAAILAPDKSTTVTLLIAGAMSILLVLTREQKLSRLVQDIRDLLSIEPKTTSIALERSLQHIQSRMLILAVISLGIIFLSLLVGLLDITVARNYALLVLVALSPIGLELELRFLLTAKRGTETVRTAIGYAVEDARALLAIIGLSLLGTVAFQIPPAIGALQILFISCVARLLLSGRALQSLPYKADQTWRVTVTALVCYGSFIFYFVRHYLDPRYADSVNPVVWQATAVTLATFIACQAVIILFEARRLPRIRFSVLLASLLLINYALWLADYFNLIGLSPSDWAWVLLGATTYGALYVIRHRRSRIN